MVNADSQPTLSRRSSKGVVVPHRPKFLQRVAARLAFLMERVVMSTLRCEWHDRTGLDARGSDRVLFCLWHNRLGISMLVHRRYSHKLAALVSASRDGAMLSAMLGTHGVTAVRGSSSRRGAQALLELTSYAQLGFNLAVTPDGPRGPRYVVQKGVIDLAQLTGLPIIPVTCNMRRKYCLKSWDRFQIPLPFSKCELILGPAIRVPREASEERREELRVELQEMLRTSSKD
jgi:lysophospholipid acyltransferase (LPLAT)-like uncharacterized protein